MWERWNGDQMRSDPSMNSYNHYAYGAVADWIYRYAAGVDATPLDAGFHTIVLHPVFDARLGTSPSITIRPTAPFIPIGSLPESDGTWWARRAPPRSMRPLRKSRNGRGKPPGPVAGFFSWILLPIGISYILLPHFYAFYASMSPAPNFRVALFGAMWGVGNVSYGLTMRHLGMSLGIGVAIGVTLVIGTIGASAAHARAAGAAVQQPGGLWLMLGVIVALIGVATVSYAGHQKECSSAEAQEFNVMLGLALAVMCGIFSSGFSFGLDAATPIRDAVLKLGVNPLYARLPSYVLIMGGGAIVNMGYCFFRLAFLKNLSHPRRPEPAGPTLIRKNRAMAAAGGIMWYLQFFFYAWGEANIPRGELCQLDAAHEHIRAVRRLSRPRARRVEGRGKRPIRLLWVGIIIIIAAANLVGLGTAALG
jgi:L-rhamnose-H+ transport protein